MKSRASTPFLMAALLMGAVFSVGCGSAITVTRLAPAEINLAGVKRVAMTRIEGRDGDSLATLVSQRIMDSKRYELVERAEMDKITAEHRSALDAAFEQNQGVELGKLLPAAAIISGSVNESKVDDHVSSTSSTCYYTVGNKSVPRPCTKYRRTAKARFVANMRVFDTNTSRVLVTRRLIGERVAESSLTEGEPEGIDGDALLEACRNEVADKFLKMIAPYPVQEKVSLEEDGDLPELKQGNEYIKRGDIATAVEFYTRAVAKADANASMKPDSKGRAHYSFALGKAMAGDYDTALAELRTAGTLKQEKSWVDLEMRVRVWKADADKVASQMKEAAPADPQPQQ